MTYSKINSDNIKFFLELIGSNYVFLDEVTLEEFSHDETEDLRFPPNIVLKPQNTEQISSILGYCNKEKIPVTPCGARTGLSGGSLPIMGGIALSTEKLNQIISIDERNMQATVEPGVINQVFRNAVEEKGLFYPPDPASLEDPASIMH